MRPLRLSALALGTLALGLTLPAAAQTKLTPLTATTPTKLDAGSQVSPESLPTDAACPCQPLTIVKGDRSGWGYNAPPFMGADLIIRDLEAWRAFWAAHTAGIQPPPPPPPVDFRSRVIVAVVQGVQTSGGGPNVAVLNIEQRGPFFHITVFDDERPGPLDVITNPFHIVSVPRHCLPPQASVVFEHSAPHPGTSVVEGRVFGVRPDSPTPLPPPLPGAVVTLLGDNAEVVPRRAVAGLDGSYFLVNVPRGVQLLRAEARGFEPAEERIEVPPDVRVGRDFFLKPVPPPGKVLGHVMQRTSAGLAPLPGALVHLARAGVLVARTETDERGLYVFPEVRPGRYVLRVGCEGFLPQSIEIAVEPGQTVIRHFVLEPVLGIEPPPDIEPMP